MKGRRLLSSARAIAGAQGSADGAPLISELNILQAAHTDATTRLYKGNIAAYHARETAKAAYMKAPADLLEGIVEASNGLWREEKGGKVTANREMKMVVHDQLRVDTVDNTELEAAILCDVIFEFMNTALYARFSWGAAMWGLAREYAPEPWAEMNAIEEQLRAFLKPGVKMPVREVLSLLREWRLAALRVEHEMMGI